MLYDSWNSLEMWHLESIISCFKMIVPPVERCIAGPLLDRDDRILVAAGVDDLREEGVGINPELVHGEARNVVA